MPKDRCIACGKPIENLDFYYTYPNGKICSACIMKKDYGINEPGLLIGKQGHPEAPRDEGDCDMAALTIPSAG